jgi:hypothetical protein
MTVFYDHLVDLVAIEAELTKVLPDAQHRAHIMEMFDATLHHVMLDVVFEAIPVAHHEPFLVQFWEDPSQEGHMTFLRQHAPNIEENMRVAAEASCRQFIDSIHA